MGAGHKHEWFDGRAFIQDEDGIGLVRIAESQIGYVRSSTSLGANPHRPGFNDHRGVDDVVPMRFAVQGLIRVRSFVDGFRGNPPGTGR